MRRVSRDLHRRKFPKLLRKLKDLLARSDDHGFLQLAWAVNALQSKSDQIVRPYLTFPREADTTDIGSPYFVPSWEIETLILLLLTTDKHEMQPGLNKLYDCRKFETMGRAISFLRDVENSEYAAFGEPSNILLEVHRVGQRQFGWQRGFASSEKLYRYAYVYGQGDCARFFHQEYGLKVEEFLLASFIFFSHFRTVPWSKLPDIGRIKIDQITLQRALRLLSQPMSGMRKEIGTLVGAASGNSSPIAYLPSALRRFPIIASEKYGKKYIAPLPELIMFRATAGLYYDLRSGPQQLIAEANERFETYVRQLIQACCPGLEALPSQEYGPKKIAIATPDVLLKDGNQIVAVFECKATKLTYQAQFAENPLEEADRSYTQIVKGITQLWRFFSDARREIFSSEPVATDAHGILLTMDSWLQVSSELQDDVIARAKRNLEGDQSITDADMRPIVFCSIQDLSDTMLVSDEDELLQTFANAETPKYHGWGLRQIRKGLSAKERRKSFPLDIEELLPWWSQFQRPN